MDDNIACNPCNYWGVGCSSVSMGVHGNPPNKRMGCKGSSVRITPSRPNINDRPVRKNWLFRLEDFSSFLQPAFFSILCAPLSLSDNYWRYRPFAFDGCVSAMSRPCILGNSGVLVELRSASGCMLESELRIAARGAASAYCWMTLAVFSLPF